MQRLAKKIKTDNSGQAGRDIPCFFFVVFFHVECCTAPLRIKRQYIFKLHHKYYCKRNTNESLIPRYEYKYIYLLWYDPANVVCNLLLSSCSV